MPICLECARYRYDGISTRSDCNSCAALKKIPLHERVKKAIKDFAEGPERETNYAINSKIEEQERQAVARNERRNNMRRMCRRAIALKKISEGIKKSRHS